MKVVLLIFVLISVATAKKVMSEEVLKKSIEYHEYFRGCYAEVGEITDHITNVALSNCLNNKLNLIKENGDVNPDEVRLLFQTVTDEEVFVKAATEECIKVTDRDRKIRVCFDMLRHPYKIAFLQHQ